MSEQGIFYEIFDTNKKEWDAEHWRERCIEWKQTAGKGDRYISQRNWKIGDLLVEGNRHFKVRKLRAEAEKLTGNRWGTLKNFMWMAEKFPMSRRRDILSWSHHREVANLPVEIQDELLSTCSGKESIQSIKYFRRDVKKRLKEARESDSQESYSKGLRPFVDRDNYKLKMELGYVDTQALLFLFATEKEVHGEKTAEGMIRWLINRSLKDLGWAEKAKAFLKSAGIPHKP